MSTPPLCYQELRWDFFFLALFGIFHNAVIIAQSPTADMLQDDTNTHIMLIARHSITVAKLTRSKHIPYPEVFWTVNGPRDTFLGA